jgi:serine/threonine protein kinase
VIYEMAVKLRPFRGETSAELISSILRDLPTPVTELRSELPFAFQTILERCLAKEANARYPSMKELCEELRRLQSNIGSSSPSDGSTGKSANQSIAVLPFANMSSDPENEFFADGITEEISNALAQIKNLHVAARMSAFSFKREASRVK